MNINITKEKNLKKRLRHNLGRIICLLLKNISPGTKF